MTGNANSATSWKRGHKINRQADEHRLVRLAARPRRERKGELTEAAMAVLTALEVHHQHEVLALAPDGGRQKLKDRQQREHDSLMELVTSWTDGVA